ncbi:MAG: GGDEF domain-containing protein [Candidatus Melainabacteria bacterium]|nr:GGDEF domain-containing protein [Candidatus Melainabacteria bacterium]
MEKVTDTNTWALSRFAKNFAESLLDAGVQSPWNGVTQLVEHVVHADILPELHLVEPSQQADIGTSDWFGQVLGGGVGMAASYFMVKKCAGRLMGGRAMAGAATREAMLISPGTLVAHEARAGALYSLVFTPVQAGEGNFNSARFRHAITGGLTFGTMAHTNVKLASSLALSERTLAKSIIGSTPVAGLISGVPAGIVNAESNSLLSGRGFASASEVGRAALEFSFVGGTLGLAHRAFDGRRVGDSGQVEGQLKILGKNVGVGKALIELESSNGRRAESTPTGRLRVLGKDIGLSQTIIDLTNELARARELAATDALTGVTNRGAGMEALSRQCSQAERHGKPLSVIFLDLDHFKQINDTRGHAAGDAVLQAASQIMRKQVRNSDIVFRAGGEEFCIVLPYTSLSRAAWLATRLRNALNTTIPFGESGIPITASLGVAELRALQTPDALMAAADSAMYQAKELGRNRVVVAGDLPKPVDAPKD